MIAVWILLGIFLLLAILLCCSVRVRLDYTDKLTVTIRFLFLKFRITLPENEKTEKEKKRKNKKLKSAESAGADEVKKKRIFSKPCARRKASAARCIFCMRLQKF